MLGVDPATYSKPPDIGVYVHGLFLEGCAWDETAGTLCESKPKVLFTSAPCMWLIPCRTTEYKEFAHYNCPVYRQAERKGTLATTGHSTNFVMFIRMPSDMPKEHWTMRGVAMLKQLSD